MNSSIINKLEETNKKLEEKMLNKLEETYKKLDETRAKIRTEMDQSMENIQRQFKTIKERINEKWEKKYVEVDCKMVEIQEQVDNNSGQINCICERLREQDTKLINVEAKINQHKEERIQVGEDFKKQKLREIVNYIEENIKIGNSTGHNVITNYSKIERKAPKFHPSKTQHPKVSDKSIQYGYYVEGNLEDEVLKKNVGIEMNIINVNVGKDDENDYIHKGNWKTTKNVRRQCHECEVYQLFQAIRN
ncbi:hypothetical protein FQA39_LY03902 [Lamprigera yunnana]|nr:hypothetical protein FQA39_LY03902 [Lamprigera yunnana]